MNGVNIVLNRTKLNEAEEIFIRRGDLIPVC
jgi:hypothetical protein